jgi:hypothetical protein
VLFLTAAFAIALSPSPRLSWRAQVAQERWSRLVGVETRAIATLEELIRAQNAYRARQELPRGLAASNVADHRYRPLRRGHVPFRCADGIDAAGRSTSIAACGGGVKRIIDGNGDRPPARCWSASRTI